MLEEEALAAREKEVAAQEAALVLREVALVLREKEEMGRDCKLLLREEALAARERRRKVVQAHVAELGMDTAAANLGPAWAVAAQEEVRLPNEERGPLLELDHCV